LGFAPLTEESVLQSSVVLSRVTLHSPDLADSRRGRLAAANSWAIDTTKVSRYFIVECLT